MTPTTPTIHCVRHAQGYHNLSVANHNLPDPLLTHFGEEKCRNLQRRFPYMGSVDLVVASPLKRTINTALIAFEPVLKAKGLKVIALPELQETSDLPCDRGSAPELLAKEFEGKPVDLSLVKPGWDSKRMKWAPTSTAIEKRAGDARRWLMARPEKAIVVVSHGGFLHYFTEDWSGAERFVGTGWANTEFRSYTFSTYQPEEAHLLEMAESKRRRMGHEKPLDHNEATQLKRTKSNQLDDFAARERRELQRQLEMAAGERAGDVGQIQAKV